MKNCTGTVIQGGEKFQVCRSSVGKIWGPSLGDHPAESSVYKKCFSCAFWRILLFNGRLQYREAGPWADEVLSVALPETTAIPRIMK